MSDSELLHHFEHCSLLPSLWTHEAHIRVAWLYLKAYEESTALQLVRTGIKRFNDRVLKKALAYHETITVAFIRLIAHERDLLEPDHTFEDFKLNAGDLLDRKLTALFKYYRSKTLHSEQARAHFVAPDLCPLPSPSTAL
jgi:hypothetical protein